jgi:hypothetical protein
MDNKYARLPLPGGCFVLMAVCACYGDQGTPGNAALCCAICTALFLEEVERGMSITSELCAAIVRSASETYNMAKPDHGGRWQEGLLDVEEALQLSGVGLETGGLPVQGAIPPADKAVVTSADLLKSQLPLSLAFSIDMVRCVIDAALSARAVHKQAVNIGKHFIGLVIDGRNGPGHCVVQIFDSFGSITPFFYGSASAFSDQILLFTLAENSSDLPAGCENVSEQQQTALDSVYNRQQPQQPMQDLGSQEYVPMCYRLFHFLMGYCMNSRHVLSGALDAYNNAFFWQRAARATAVVQACRYIEIARLVPVTTCDNLTCTCWCPVQSYDS